LRKALGVIARQQGRGLADVASETGASVVGDVSLKAALDLDWDDPTARETALRMVLDALAGCERWLEAHPEMVAADPAVLTSLATAAQVCDQDVRTSEAGTPTLREGVAADRRISIEDGQMRHGRKSRSQLIDGYKRHVLRDLDSGLIAAVGVTPATQPEATVTDSISLDLHVQGLRLRELHIDRAYLSSRLVAERDDDLYISCKAWPVHTGPHFAKTAFVLDWEQPQIRCPNGVVLPFRVGANVQFPAERCDTCALRERCTSSKTGRTVSIHPDERLLEELRERQLTAAGRAKLRERIAVEHSLAHIGQWQGDRARYWGERKNLFDLRRTAVVHNLHIIARAPELAQAA
jgi:DDE family transposase